MAKKRKKAGPTDGDVRMLLIDRLTGLGGKLITVGGWVLIAFFVKESIEVLAGKETSANFAVSIPLSPRIACVAAAFFGLGGIVFGLVRWLLAKLQIEHLSEYKRMYQSERDPNRTSSKLTPRGETREEDK